MTKIAYLAISAACLLAISQLAAEAPYMANGIKIGEVTENSAIVWTRLTAVPEMVTTGEKLTRREDVTPPKTAPEFGSVPGTKGQVRLKLSVEGSADEPRITEWRAVDPDRGHVHQFLLDDLLPGTKYVMTVESKGGVSLNGSFSTAPDAEATGPVSFCVATCHDYHRRDEDGGHKIYRKIATLDPSFFVHAGDIVYFDRGGPVAENLEVARYKFTRLYALPNQREFHLNVPSYFMKDDHDTLTNDCYPGQSAGDLTFDQGVALFREQFPVARDAATPTYRTVRWGRDLQVWMVEGRDYRSPNKSPDGPEKSIWGAEQKAWFFETFAASDATFRILISPTPVVGPDRKNKKDNHANAVFAHEGNEIRQFLATQKNAYVICGDRHWQYHSIDPETGVQEFACGPGGEGHAGGFSKEDQSDAHQYLNIIGGFLQARVERVDGVPTLTMTHRNVRGRVENKTVLVDGPPQRAGTGRLYK